ncbi:MAG: alpha/beta hydrolase [Chloroflexi bacterium]|nr:alpha/beta hydrolase [Chloroflexota bacterium]
MPTVKVNHASIYYEVNGAGPAVTFAHGAGGNTLVWWQQIPYFAEDYKVVVFDHRGFGRSPCDEGYKHARYFADDLKAVLDDAGVAKTALVCQSMGGWTGMHFTMAHPEAVSCLVLSGTPGGVMTPKVAEARDARARSRAAESSAVRPWNQSHWALAEGAFERNPGLSYLYGIMSGLNAPLGDTGTGELGIPSEKLQGFSTPTLMIGGEKDRIFPIEALEEVSQIIPGARLHRVAGSGHSPYFEAADEFNRVAGEFISRHAV